MKPIEDIDLPMIPSVYSLYAKGQLIYIGTTINLRNRIYTQRAWLRRIEIDNVTVEYMAIADKRARLKTEFWLITRYKPILNCTGRARDWPPNFHERLRLFKEQTIQ